MSDDAWIKELESVIPGTGPWEVIGDVARARSREADDFALFFAVTRANTPLNGCTRKGEIRVEFGLAKSAPGGPRAMGWYSVLYDDDTYAGAWQWLVRMPTLRALLPVFGIGLTSGQRLGAALAQAHAGRKVRNVAERKP